MRITGGKYGGQKLLGPTHQGLRPTTDRVREALFSILGDSFRHGRVLDLFAGSGALGIEALSRGAREVCFVENDPKGLRLLKQNLQRLPDVTTEVSIFPVDVLRILPKISREEQAFDLILLDPPFKAKLWLRVIELISRLPLLTPTGQLVVEIPKYDLLPNQVDCLQRVDKRVYGEVSLEFWKYITDGADDDGYCHLPG
ncbi:MAG TPA: 16S rRNA (guanine(966)-N(2))-methyltransferase RsmD [Firmicutes bacterium]|jgi:16S rRNA (guanine(966)-N(2))-methyltransferase RsmD|nr:16S rRNA (guanine(966)-N(2))-methyltransferase RsmD [Bacillota bacterium]HBR33159.1 16S rRNA (guanine(966)-N(2))-methyltransferase RsmD [Bacillota bacterium]